MDRNKFRYCTLLLIDAYNHSKIFISEKNKYYIKNDNKSIHAKILNKFKDIRKSYEINVIDISDNYYEIDKDYIIRHCTILLMDDDNRSKIFISEENLYCSSYVGGDYCDYCDDDDDDDDYVGYVGYDDELVYYDKPLNDFERLVSDKNNIVNLINNDNYRHNITLLVKDFEILICENVY